MKVPNLTDIKAWYCNNPIWMNPCLQKNFCILTHFIDFQLHKDDYIPIVSVVCVLESLYLRSFQTKS